MNQLSKLLERAFENKGNKNYYTSGQWSVGFEARPYETLFEVCNARVPILSGTTFDKTVHLCTDENVYPYSKLLKAVSEALPDYNFTGEVFERYTETLSLTPEREEEYLQCLMLSNDPDDRIKAVKSGYGLNILVNDEMWSVREAVAYQGYGLDKLIQDSDIEVEVAALLYLEAIGMDADISGWISANPDKCVLPENTRKESLDNMIAEAAARQSSEQPSMEDQAKEYTR